MSILTLFTALFVIISLGHSGVLLVLSRRWSDPTAVAPANLIYVFVVPCLNEERVINQTVESLLSLGRRDVYVMVIDDGSDDATPKLLQRYDDEVRVEVLSRVAPVARQGKGKALNAAYRLLRDQDWGGDEVVFSVLDADGRLEPGALEHVGPYFADPTVGAVQIGVRIRNAADHRLARLQDMEFLLYTEVYQRGRNVLSSPHLGGNGQFVRLSALCTLGDDPWSDCLTEDLDLGLRLLLAGHQLRYCPATWVDQQGLTSLPKLIRQRTRWFQGHLQCHAFLRAMWESDLPLRTRVDLMLHLGGPFLLLGASLLMTAGWLFALGRIVLAGRHAPELLLGPPMMKTYLLAFAPSPIVAWVWWRREPETPLSEGLIIAHLYVFYGCIWFASGWWAVHRMVTGAQSWAKTARLVEPTSLPTTAARQPARSLPSMEQAA